MASKFITLTWPKDGVLVAKAVHESTYNFIVSNLVLYCIAINNGKLLRTINFAIFTNFTAASKIPFNSSYIDMLS